MASNSKWAIKPSVGVLPRMGHPLSDGWALHLGFEAARDMLGRHPSGTMRNGASWRSGPMGQEMVLLSASTQLLDLGQTGIDTAGGPDLSSRSFSIAVWHRPTSFDDRTIYCYGNGAGGTRALGILAVRGTTTAGFYMYNDDLEVSTPTMTAGLPVHHVVTYQNGSNNRVFYQNGRLIGSNTAGGPIVSADKRTFVGYRTDSTWAYNGSIIQVDVWVDRVLTPAEVQTLYDDPWTLYQPQDTSWDYLFRIAGGAPPPPATRVHLPLLGVA